MAGEILLSVDMDEWYQCRWATGSAHSIWPDTKTCFREYYHSETPGGEIIPLTGRILDLFDSHDAKATFFFTGEIASYYPDLVKSIANAGHEIGCHNYYHVDFNLDNQQDFAPALIRSRKLLQDLSGQPVVGYRAPNSTIANYMIRDLIDAGIEYDSSVTPTRPFMGKFGNFTKAPLNPYRLSEGDFSEVGESPLWEFPWPVFPMRQLPAGSGIMTRIAGYRYTTVALEHALKTGDSVYYFHPYEIGPHPNLTGLDLRTRVFMRNLGEPYFDMLKRLVERYAGRFRTGAELLAKHRDGGSLR